MVDLSLMHALTRALPEETSLLLLGDSDQLESVEVGGILAELVQRGSSAPLPPQSLIQIAARLGCEREQAQRDFEDGLPTPSSTTLAALPGLMLGLKYSRRAMNAPWILELADIVRPGGSLGFRDLEALFANQPAGRLTWHRNNPGRSRAEVCRLIWQTWADKSEAWCPLETSASKDSLQSALQELLRFQLLCSNNAQVDRANLEGLALLWKAERATPNALPHGCPIIVQANSYSLGLSNGDVGIALGNKPHHPATLAIFASSSGAPRLIPLAQLPSHRAAFGLTIHKSQGSEWEHIAIELPAESGSELLSRNLLYTAITRSSRQIDVFGSAFVLEKILSEGR
jgi:exodeoxyribonuclease V alpha subunit